MPGAVQHAKSLKDKKVWRRSAVIDALLPSGANKVGTFPRREEERYGDEDEEGDRLFETAMAAFKAEEFGDSSLPKARDPAEAQAGMRQPVV
jgi:hypothetical protein